MVPILTKTLIYVPLLIFLKSLELFRLREQIQDTELIDKSKADIR